MNQVFNKTLYGLDTKGDVKVWQISVDEGAEGFLIRHGKYGGKMTEKFTKTTGKNIGRANETTPHTQAVFEAGSRVAKQVDKGYNENLADAGQNKNPMLAHDYRKQGHRIKFGCKEGVYVQPKLDGVRCLAFLEGDDIILRSRGGKNYPVHNHIKEELMTIFKVYPKLILDGELYVHGRYLQEIVSAVKKKNELTPELEFHIFDIYHESDTWEKRRDTLETLFIQFDKLNKIVQVLDYPVENENEMKKYHDEFTAKGYEGVMIRNGFGVYSLNYRSPDLQKYKEFLDEEFKVVDVKEDNEGFGVPVCITSEGKTFDPTYKATHEERARLLREKHLVIGKMATVKFQAYTKDNVPQFPVTVSIRDYE